jgi:hypothetical protein
MSSPLFRQISLIAGFGLLLGTALPSYATSVYRRSGRQPLPVVRANPNIPQNPICFGDLPNMGKQDLIYACMVGKPVAAKPKAMFNMQLDQDKDGVPDELGAWFAASDKLSRMSIGATPAGRLAEASKQRDLFRELADRMPTFSPEGRETVRQLADFMYESATYRPRSSPEERAAYEQRMKKYEKVLANLDRDPALKQISEYDRRYREARRPQR